MTDVVLHPTVERFRGAMGRMVFKKYKGRTIVCRKPDVNETVSQAQIDHRERFKQAAAYGKLALANPATRALYEQAAKEKDVPVFSVCVADFFHAPTIKSVDLSAYNGQVGDTIQVIASDDFGVVNVHLTLKNAEGTFIESGNAIEVGTGHWNYTATASVAAGTPVIAYVVATDRPGGTAVESMGTTIR